MWEYNYTCDSDFLMHYGVEGMKWGIRNYQNPDGSLTYKGRMRYGKFGKKSYKLEKKLGKKEYRLEKAKAKGKSEKSIAKRQESVDKAKRKLDTYNERFGDLPASEIANAVSFRKTRNHGLALATLGFGVIGGITYTAYKHGQYRSEQRAANMVKNNASGNQNINIKVKVNR